MALTRELYIEKISNLTVEQITQGIRAGAVTFKELQDTHEFDNEKQKRVRAKLDGHVQEDNAFKAATTKSQLLTFQRLYPESEHPVREKIDKIERDEKEALSAALSEIRRNINDYTPDEIIKKIGRDSLRVLCDDLNIDYDVVINFREPSLKFNLIPQNVSEVPTGYTDVFFWGVPSSGKTCALSSILSTIKDKYTMESPTIATKFGATYRDSLVNIFRNGTGYLPDSTQKDRTQYMPFLLKKRDEKKYRQISFFELSGEVFKYFYEVVNGVSILDDADRSFVETAFHTLEMLIRSKNQKIHFFFIDYNQETRGSIDKHGLNQGNYLEAAATYFRDTNDIFKKGTDAVYVVVTKSDLIKGHNRSELAKQFLTENFGGFMNAIQHRCKKDSVEFNVKMFSIGDVYFKRICKIDHSYSVNIVEDLLSKVRPVKSDSIFNR